MNLGFEPAAVAQALGVLAVVAIVARLVLLTSRRADLPYTAARSALSSAERSFHGVLRQAVGSEYEIFAKMRLADVIEVEKGISARRRYSAFGRISAKHLDFVLCERGTFRIVGTIELDDSSHQREDRRQRDAFVDAALAAAGVPILRFPARRAYSAAEIRARVFQNFRRPHGHEESGAPPQPSAADAHADVAPVVDLPIATSMEAPSRARGRRPMGTRWLLADQQGRALLWAGALSVALIVAAGGLLKPRSAPSAAGEFTSPSRGGPAPSAPSQPSASALYPQPAPNAPGSALEAKEARRIVGYREIRVPGKPLEDCIGSDNELNDQVKRCREGYTQREPIYR